MNHSQPGSSVHGIMGFPRQGHWSGLPFPSAGDLPDPGIEAASPALAGELFSAEPPGKPVCKILGHICSVPGFGEEPGPACSAFDYPVRASQCLSVATESSVRHGLVCTCLMLGTL